MWQNDKSVFFFQSSTTIKAITLWFFDEKRQSLDKNAVTKHLWNNDISLKILILVRTAMHYCIDEYAQEQSSQETIIIKFKQFMYTDKSHWLQY